MMDLPKYPLTGDEGARSDVTGGVYFRKYQPLATDVVWDLGAHVGFFTEHVLSQYKVSAVVAFEPLPRNAWCFRQRMKQLTGHQIHFWEAAFVGRARTDGILYYHVRNSGGSTVEARLASENPDQFLYQIPVKTLSMTDLFRKDSPLPDFVKIDTERLEEDIVPDILDFCRPKAFAVELHTSQALDILSKAFPEAGYKIDFEGSIMFANL